MEVENLIRLTARKHGVPEDLALRVARQESGFNQGAVSGKGAIGVMQLMPGTAQDLGVNPRDLHQNIDGGIRYLKRQLDDFGDERLALAAYNAGPGAVRKHGGVPPYRETQDYVRKISGGADVQGFDGSDIFGMGKGASRAAPAAGFNGADIFGMGAAPGGQPPPAGPVPVPQLGPGVTAELDRPAPARPTAPQQRTSQSLGLAKGLAEPWQRTIERGATANATTRQVLPDALATGLGFMDQVSIPGMIGALSGTVMDRVRGAEASGTRAGKVGEFAGNVGATLPFWMLGPGVGGGMSGLLTSKADDTAGLATDAGIGAAFGKGADELARVAAPYVGRALSKVPKPPTQEQLRLAKKAAYDRLKALGGAYTGSSKASLLAKFRADMARDGLDQGANPGAWAVFQRAEKVLSGKGPISLDDLDNLRQTAWRQAAGLKGADKEAERYYGEAMIRLIDDFVDTATPSSTSGATGPELSAAIKEARRANQIWRKTERINNMVDSADLRAAAAYTGTNTDNTIRQQTRQLVDPTSASRMRGTTKDEDKALRRVVKGSTGQNVARTVGQLVDPRRLLGMGLQGAGGVATGGLSLMSAPLGVLNTVLSNRASQQNVQRLLELIAAGGSKQALVKVPTVTSRAIQAAMTAAPVVAPVGAVQARESRQRTGAQTRR